MNKILKIVIWTLGVLIALMLLIMALSPVAKYVINHHGKSILGRDMLAERVLINPFVGSVTIDDFHLREQNGETDFVAFDELYVRVNYLALMSKHVNVRSVYLNNFTGQVLSNDTAFNFSDIVSRFSSSDQQPQDTTPSSWRVSLNNIHLSNGHLIYHDVTRDNRWGIDNINLSIPGLYFGSQQSNAGLVFDLPTGGNVRLSAGYVMASRRYALTLTLGDVNTDVALPIVRDYLRVSGIGALVSGRIHVDGGLDNVRDMIINGNISVRGLSLRDDHDDEVASLDEVRLVVSRANMLTNRVTVDSLVVNGMSGTYLLDEDDNTLSRLLVEHQSDTLSDEQPIAEIQSPASSAPLNWTVRHLDINGRNLKYVDRSMKKRFEYAIESLRLTGSNVTPYGDNHLSLQATLTHGARLKANFDGNFNLQQGLNTISAKLTGVRVEDFSPYAESLMAYPLEGGELAFESNNTIRDGELVGTNRLTIDQMQVGRKQRFNKAPYRNVPLKLGVSLLRSASGIIVMDLPVTGNVRSPKFSYRQIIRRALLKVFFGPLMGVRDNRKLISADELEEMMELLGEDTLNLAVEPLVPDSLLEDYPASDVSDSDV